MYAVWFRLRSRLWFLGVKRRNFGDNLNPYLIEHITGKKPVFVSRNETVGDEPIYMVIGSILHWATNTTVVWGAGFGSDDAQLKAIPRKVCAVRGPLTRNRLLSLGVDCPEVYGDPALLYPRYYSPEVETTYDLGVVPHFMEHSDSNIKTIQDVLGSNYNYKILDVRKPVHSFLRDLNRCKKIISSSLHGIIMADAYKIPSAHFMFSNDDYKTFKFQDYYQSVHKKYNGPLILNRDLKTNDIEDGIDDSQIQIDLDLLLKSCPFANGQ